MLIAKGRKDLANNCKEALSESCSCQTCALFCTAQVSALRSLALRWFSIKEGPSLFQSPPI